ncbi:MAG: TonB-dependent receptor [Phenylobacterium sp.]|nr:MAG: TonB-dependent receptor [Phenylobacterium sp.]
MEPSPSHKRCRAGFRRLNAGTALGGLDLRVRVATTVLCALTGAALTASAAHADAVAPGEAAVEQLRGLSIEDLANVQVTTVSRHEESLAQAPASAYVITHEEIVRSGAQTLPEMLRLAPNLYVAQSSAYGYVITARGLSGNSSFQNFSNKLLVLIDGRSVYTPLFSGVSWDLQDVLPEDIDHIEVISGPAGTLWGANAVEGVINIITRKSGDTQGGFVSAGGGELESSIGLRYGGKIGDQATWRIYAHGYKGDSLDTPTGGSAHDGFDRVQGGFRVDWAASDKDTLFLEGDALDGSGDQFDNISGGNVTGRWNHLFAGGSDLQVQAYVNREAEGHDITGGVPLWLNSYDLDVQHSLSLGARNDFVWGGEVRITQYRIEPDGGLAFQPPRRTLNLADLFAQDTFALASSLKLTLGLKLEHDPFSGWSPMPNARLAWTPNPTTLIWAAASRAIRAPTPFDDDVRETVGGSLFLHGNLDFQPERLTAYELGARLQPTSRISLSATAFYNVYDDLRSIEATPVTLIPLFWGNGVQGHTYGLEAWGNFQAAPWWRLSASVDLLKEDFNIKPGFLALGGISEVADDPKRQAMLKSSMDLGPAVTWDAQLRYVSALPDPALPAYTELNTRVGWRVSPKLELSLSGFNLLHARHVELPGASAVPRTVFAELRWGF